MLNNGAHELQPPSSFAKIPSLHDAFNFGDCPPKERRNLDETQQLLTRSILSQLGRVAASGRLVPSPERLVGMSFAFICK